MSAAIYGNAGVMSLSYIAALATAGGVVLVALQLWWSRRQARTALEDELSLEYRQIAHSLPVEAFFDAGPESVSAAGKVDAHLRHYLRYVSNQQVFLRSQRRVSRRTWALWRDGIRDNLQHRQAFSGAWDQLSSRATRSFHELRRLEDDWTSDPGWWASPWWMLPAKPFLSTLPIVGHTSSPRSPEQSPEQSRIAATDARDDVTAPRSRRQDAGHGRSRTDRPG